MKFKIYLLFVLICLTIDSSFAQNKNVKLPPNWFNLDLIKDGYFGISTEKAYNELLKSRTPTKKVVVAVIDGGVDINHEDLKDNIWVNTKEISGNGIDDDHNGYIDDVHGWNFIGSKAGNLQFDNLELVRIYRKLNPKYKSTIKSTVLDSAQKEEFALYKRVTAEFGKKYDDADQQYRVLFAINKVLDSVASTNKKAVPTLEEVEAYKATDEMEEQVKKIIRSGSRKSNGYDKFYKEVKDAYKQTDIMLRYNLNPKYDVRERLVGDDYANSKERIYGNPDVIGPDADHGTHVSGIIAANRNNTLGINGVANSVLIMPIRVVPDGDERDKDVANGIRYAVDNGANIINMSFGKSYNWDKQAVDEAIKYAEVKGVLLVHAAGNDNLNNDTNEEYPSKYYISKEYIAYFNAMKKRHAIEEVIRPLNPQMQGRQMPQGPVRVKPAILDTLKFDLPHVSNWLEVGASAYKNDDNLKAEFSNYGKHTVDVFAPGFMINSTVPGSKYEEFDGTSMAAPVVSGLSALIWSYYPNLTAVQIRDIVIKSVTKVDRKIKYKIEKEEPKRGYLSDISLSGGVVNAYNALKMAETLSTGSK
ncbi:MAG: peptidase [Pedobacter sp.]|nr:peptidase [Pedobacter sp.]